MNYPKIETKPPRREAVANCLIYDTVIDSNFSVTLHPSIWNSHPAGKNMKENLSCL
jgi:hypothetical protein